MPDNAPQPFSRPDAGGTARAPHGAAAADDGLLLAGDTVEDMMRLMTDRRIRHVPVVTQDGRLGGIISIGDVVKSRIDELEADRDQLIGYIQSGR